MNKHYQSTAEIIRMAYSKIIDKVLDEIVRAHEKFPSWPSDIIHASAIVAEESGELSQAALKSIYEQGNQSDAEKEAIQVACTAFRFLNNMNRYKKPVYRVKYSFYHYNTGAGDNFSGVGTKDFPTFEEALAYKAKVDAGKVPIEDGYIITPALIVLAIPTGNDSENEIKKLA